MNHIKITSILFLLVIFFACTKNVVTGRKQLNLIPEKELIGMSLTEYDNFLKQHKTLPQYDNRVIQVRNVGNKIKAAVEKLYAQKGMSNELKMYQWEFNVVEENIVNAWCMPGGKVVVYTGILPVTQDDAGLAVVMGHEISHALAKHGNERMSQAMLAQFGQITLAMALSQKPQETRNLFLAAYGVGAGLSLLKYSRNQEAEADKMGLILMAMAGYNPEEAIHFWSRMAAQGGQKPPEILSTHPSDETRIKLLREFLPEAKKYYQPD
ncbi:MAG: M48 family metallopeptidase [Bacteroidia bacterium]|nr:M48 family metallopeptidase [Bacteroidia bacterium]